MDFLGKRLEGFWLLWSLQGREFGDRSQFTPRVEGINGVEGLAYERLEVNTLFFPSDLTIGKSTLIF